MRGLRAVVGRVHSAWRWVVGYMWAQTLRERAMATEQTKKAAPDTGIGRRGVTAPWVILISLMFVVESLVLLYAVMVFWPPTLQLTATGQQTGSPPATTAAFFGNTIVMTREQNLLLLMAILGALGAMGHVFRSFFKYVGERGLLWSWMPQYVLIPFVGAILATITYILLRAGLIGGSSTGAVPEGNTWGFAAVATLVGLFSAQAAEKLKDVFEIVLSPAQKGGETVGEAAEAVVSVTPRQGAVDSRVEIRGSGLEGATAVTFPGGVESQAAFDAVALAVVTTVPAGATSGFLVVTVPTGSITTTEDFTVT